MLGHVVSKAVRSESVAAPSRVFVEGAGAGRVRAAGWTTRREMRGGALGNM